MLHRVGNCTWLGIRFLGNQRLLRIQKSFESVPGGGIVRKQFFTGDLPILVRLQIEKKQSMKQRFFHRWFFYLFFFGNLLTCHIAEACTFCFGNPNSHSTKGVKIAVLFLLGVVIFVLGAVACVIMTWVGRARRLSAQDGKDKEYGLASSKL